MAQICNEPCGFLKATFQVLAESWNEAPQAKSWLVNIRECGCRSASVNKENSRMERGREPCILLSFLLNVQLALLETTVKRQISTTTKCLRLGQREPLRTGWWASNTRKTG